MKLAEVVRLKWLLGALLIAAAALFAIGAASERASHSETSESVESAEHSEAGGEEAHVDSAESSEKVLGLNLESTPLVVLAVAVSVALAAATWRTDNKLVIGIAGLFALAFAVLDVAEFVHQIDRSAAGFAALAAVIALLHASAAVVADQRRRAVGSG